MTMTPEQGKDYLLKHNIQQLVESVLIGLVHERPSDPVDFIQSCMAITKDVGGIPAIKWNTFLKDRPITPDLDEAEKIFPTETPENRGSLASFSDGGSRRSSRAMDGKMIIFVIGGPGSGKGTMCERIVEKYGFAHFSSGDLLRAEVASGSPLGQELHAIMERGALVPLSTVLKLIKDKMVQQKEKNGFLIDGYPREVEQGIQFENTVAACSIVLWLDVSQETMVKRLLKRGETSGRADDNEETIKKRLQTFVDATEPVIEHYQKLKKVRRVDAEHEIEAVFTDVQQIIDELLEKSSHSLLL